MVKDLVKNKVNNNKKKKKKRKGFKWGEVASFIIDKFADILIATRFNNFRPNPYAALGELIKKILEDRKNLTKTQIKRALNRFKKRKIIDFVQKDGEVFVYIEDKGREKIIHYSLKKLINYKRKEKKWNGNWFFVFFDVPEIERKKRNYLRKLLRYLGFYPYQKSVYVFPFECQKEVSFIKKIVEGAEYTRFIIAKKVENEEVIKRYFNL
ncbi:MAG: CRISPR-associated endonuclease Cas2 [Patescibacteria group bacterium]|nr:CRISPR-associated endonuclease Cas2 [Patescibacteria group bacterium]